MNKCMNEYTTFCMHVLCTYVCLHICMYVCIYIYTDVERERERDRHRQRETDRETQTERDRRTDRQQVVASLRPHVWLLLTLSLSLCLHVSGGSLHQRPPAIPTYRGSAGKSADSMWAHTPVTGDHASDLGEIFGLPPG